MQEKVRKKGGAIDDSILAGDLQYLVPEGSRIVQKGGVKDREKVHVYIAYPSVRVPRFLIPAQDTTAQKFILKMMSDGLGNMGALLRMALYIPGGVVLFRFFLFRERVYIANND